VTITTGYFCCRPPQCLLASLVVAGPAITEIDSPYLELDIVSLPIRRSGPGGLPPTQCVRRGGNRHGNPNGNVEIGLGFPRPVAASNWLRTWT